MGTIDCYTTLGAPRTQASSFSVFFGRRDEAASGCEKTIVW